jgi:hypothetical protein
MKKCDNCGSGRLLKNYMADERAYIEVTMPNIPHLQSDQWEWCDFTVCLECGKVQGKFPVEEHSFEQVVRKAGSGEYDADLYYEDRDEFEFEHEEVYGIEGLECYLKKTPDSFVYHIEEVEGKGFALINKKKGFEGEYTTEQWVYSDDLPRRISQVKPGLFVYKVGGEIGTGDELRGELEGLGFENIQMEESIFA